MINLMIKLHLYKEKLIKFHNLIKNLPTNNQNLGKIAYIGKLMKLFYTLYDDQEIENIFNFLLDFMDILILF